jgi:hypothetical protein
MALGSHPLAVLLSAHGRCVAWIQFLMMTRGQSHGQRTSVDCPTLRFDLFDFLERSGCPCSHHCLLRFGVRGAGRTRAHQLRAALSRRGRVECTDAAGHDIRAAVPGKRSSLRARGQYAVLCSRIRAGSLRTALGSVPDLRYLWAQGMRKHDAPRNAVSLACR